MSTMVTCAARYCWYEAKVETDAGCYTGRVRLDASRPILDQIVSEPNAYLRLWNARLQGAASEDQLLVLNKRAVRSIELLGRGAGADA